MFVTMIVPEKDYVDCLGFEEYEPQINSSFKDVKFSLSTDCIPVSLTKD